MTISIEADEIFKRIEEDRKSGKLQEEIMKYSGGIVYQSCKENPNKLEQVRSDGTVIIGTFKNGKFIPD